MCLLCVESRLNEKRLKGDGELFEKRKEAGGVWVVRDRIKQ